MNKPGTMLEHGDDRCSKWRRILKELADQLPEDASWWASAMLPVDVFLFARLAREGAC
jgi:hypothetical protein